MTLQPFKQRSSQPKFSAGASRQHRRRQLQRITSEHHTLRSFNLETTPLIKTMRTAQPQQCGDHSLHNVHVRSRSHQRDQRGRLGRLRCFVDHDHAI